ncbi:DoxX family protein [Pseudoxanthomonas suwonensis]|uniref:DoxX family protein n=1 Tax=Pseudoxanthomonas suwonensis TaxID=314722 RepID=UPI0009D749D6|nr:hypothetical protein [Pseudoxanthomonas suwonensis]
MTNIVIMLILLTGPYLLARSVSFFTGGRTINIRSAAAWGAGTLFIFTGIGHFVQTEQLTWMLPDWVPQRTFLIYATGVLEFVIAAGFFLKKTRWFSGVIAIVVLVVFFPANIYAAFKHIPMSGNEWGPIYLLVRGPLQAIIISWIYWFVAKKPNNSFNPTPLRGAA